MPFENALPVQAFPGFTHSGAVADAVREIVVTINAESVDAMNEVPESSIAWADVGTRVTPGAIEVKVPIRLPSGASFKMFEGTRSYEHMDLFAPLVKAAPSALNFEWGIVGKGDNVTLAKFQGADGIASVIINAGRAEKARLVASLFYNGFTNAALGLTAQSLTYEQPGNPNGLPLYVDASQTMHYSHPLKSTSSRFANLFLGVGKLGAEGVFTKCITDMAQRPHPSMPNMNMGLGVTDFVGPTHMLEHFYAMAQQRLALQVSGSSFAGTENIYSQERLKAAMMDGTLSGSTGLTPWRFWIAPQLDNHPYLVANPGKQMWITISNAKKSQRWAELVSPTKEFIPEIHLFGDQAEQSKLSRKVSMIADLDAGVAPGLPHFTNMYFETTPA